MARREQAGAFFPAPMLLYAPDRRDRPLAHHLSGSRLKYPWNERFVERPIGFGLMETAAVVLIASYRPTESVDVPDGTALRVARVRVTTRVSKTVSADGPALAEIGGLDFLWI